MKVLIGCEFSGVVRDAFIKKGHEAYSCDLLAGTHTHHLMCDVLELLDMGWDLLIAHPPCTYLCNSGVRWLYNNDGSRYEDRWQKMIQGAAFFNKMLRAPIDKIATENPIMHKHARKLIDKGPDQIVQPWQFGHGETKATCLWLKNLPPLTPTNVVSGRIGRVHKEAPSPDRWMKRSITYQGIADAMAAQWG